MRLARKAKNKLLPPSPPDSCQTPSNSNRVTALLVGYGALFVAIALLAGAFADARHKDQQKAAQLEAMTEQDRAESMIDENLGFGRAIIDADGTIIKWSGALPKWTRWTDAVGKSLLTIIPENMREVHVAAFNAALSAHTADNAHTTLVVKCELPRIDDMSKVTHVTIVTNIVQPLIEGGRPMVVAHVYRTKSVKETDLAAMRSNK